MASNHIWMSLSPVQQQCKRCGKTVSTPRPPQSKDCPGMTSDHPTIPAPPASLPSRQRRLANALRRLAADVEGYADNDGRLTELSTFLWVQSKLDELFPIKGD